MTASYYIEGGREPNEQTTQIADMGTRDKRKFEYFDIGIATNPEQCNIQIGSRYLEEGLMEDYTEYICLTVTR